MKPETPLSRPLQPPAGPSSAARIRIPVRGRHAVGLIRLGQTLLGAAAAPATPTASPRVGLARVRLQRIAVPRPQVQPVKLDRQSPSRGSADRDGDVQPDAQPCDLSLWSRGLYGVFLPDRRTATRPIAFRDRRC